MKKQVLLLNNVPAPYFTPLFEKIGNTPDWELTVCYSSGWNQDVGWQAKKVKTSQAHRTVILDQQGNAAPDLFGRSVKAAITLLRILIRESPQYVICYGYTLKPQLAALGWAMITRKPFAVIGDANYYIDSVAGLRRILKNIWLKTLTRSASAIIPIGKASRLFWEAYGARPEQLFEARFAVDNRFYEDAVAERKADAIQLREKFHLTTQVVFLFVGRLVKRKNVDLIIKAMQQLDHPRISIVIAGSGEEENALKELAAGHPRIIFTGNIAPQDLPLYYALADVFVLPAQQEPWGLVINEAMACGLAIVAHQHCGAAVDLVEKDNGVKLESFSVAELSQAMKRLAEDASLLQAMQRRSREKIQHWSIESAARGIVHAVETTYLTR